MKRLGLKKDKDTLSTNDDSNHKGLFGSRSSKPKISNPTPVSSNPYAVQGQGQAGGDPYTGRNPYAPTGTAVRGDGSSALISRNPAPSAHAGPTGSAVKSGYSGGTGNGYAGPSGSAIKNGYGDGGRSEDARSIMSVPPAYSSLASDNDRHRDNNSPGNSQSNAVPSNTRYNNLGDYGAPRGYGGDRWDAASSVAPSSASGYGGLGRSRSQETLDVDKGREKLFGGARERAAKNELPVEEDQDRGYGGGQGETDEGERSLARYGEYGHQLTGEEIEEEHVNGIKDQIRDLKRQDVSSTRNAVRIAAMAEETGRATLERLGMQGDRIHNAERNLDLSANQNRMAEEKARELKKLNRSMFVPVAGNPFTRSKRHKELENRIVEQHLDERERREASRAAAYASMDRHRGQQRDVRDASRAGGDGAPASGEALKKPSLAERSKYQFEADSEDEGMEEEIGGNLDVLAGATGRLNMLGRAIGEEIDSQNQHIARIGDKVDDVDLALLKNRRRLEHFK